MKRHDVFGSEFSNPDLDSANFPDPKFCTVANKLSYRKFLVRKREGSMFTKKLKRSHNSGYPDLMFFL
jgi:hypothetical protein